MKLREEQPSIATASHHTQASLSTSIGTTAEHRNRNTPSPNGNKKMKFCHDRTDTALVALDRSLSLSTPQSQECGTDTESYRSTDCTKRDEGFKLTVQPLDDASESSTESLSCSALFQSFSIHQNEHSSPRVQSSFPCSFSTSGSPKRVSFTVVQVQEYALTLGDHPCADSYPLSLDWEHTAEKVLPLNDYERSRDALRRNSSPIFASHPGHLSAMQRRIRLSKVAGLQPAELTRQEQQRIQKLILDQAQEHLSDFGGDDCDEPFQETIDGIPAEMDDYVFQDDFDPIQVTRSTSLSELDIDCSLLEYLYDSDDEEAQAFQANQKFRRSRRHSAP